MLAEMIAKRKSLGMTQAALGAALGTSQEMISMVESGRKLIPKELRPIIAKWLRTGQLPSQSPKGNPGK